ncbi:dermonecrotic toxin domain-containing protein [Pseudomonas sp. NR3]|uniref:dermonecrotic toxin domain-containing protein n=1 Tax=Pseudomonas sp. NR3 TaxID=3155978 RepID=UPI003B679ABE
MDDMAEWQQDRDGATSLSDRKEASAQAILEKLTGWQTVIEAKMQAQNTFLEELEVYLLVGLRTHYRHGNIDSDFIGTLLDAVLQRKIDPSPAVYDEHQDAPYRWEGGADLGFSAERRDILEQVLEGTASTILNHYEDYLRSHWKMAGHDAALESIVQEKLNEHVAAIDAILQPQRLVGLDVEQLRARIEELQQSWRHMGKANALATPRERRALEAIMRAQLPDWLRGLGAADRKRLEALSEHAGQTQAMVDELLDGLGSLEAFARRQAQGYIRRELDMEVEPDRVRVQLQWRAVIGQPVRTYNLSELVAAGPVRPDAVTVRLVENGGMLRNEPLASAFVGQMLSSLDAPAGYFSALSSRYNRADLKDALLDWFMARLRHSAFVARCAGLVTVSSHDELYTLLNSSFAGQGVGGLQVTNVELPNSFRCADLLLFYHDDAQGQVSAPLLYAPGKPDGQEWIALPSLRAVSAEIGSWIASETGREYLLQQISPVERDSAREYFVGVRQKPTTWDLSRDPRGTQKGLRHCLEQAVLTGLNHNLQQVEWHDSPRWYSALPLESRRSISGLKQESLVHQQVFDEQLAGYELFVDFAKRTVTQAIAPYMRSKGVREPVDPETVLIDYFPGLGSDRRVASLLELAIYGYDDNAGIDNPKQGVRSSVGQDLGQVRSADLALYVRGAYLGEKYTKEIRARFLDANDPQYQKRRDACRYMLLAKMDRDLRIAYGRSVLSTDAFNWLTRQVTLLSDRRPAGGPIYPATAVTREGVFKFTVNGHVVLGVYVFAYFEPKGSYWLYTPDAPDGIRFRNYLAFTGRTAAQLHDYVVERVALIARGSVEQSLRALGAGTTRVDTLREFSRVVDIDAEFDACIERAIADVEDITTRRAEAITQQIQKGLLFAAAPVCMVFPPFALLLDIVFIGLSSKQAIEAHRQGDTQEALEHWLEVSWGALLAVPGVTGMAALLRRSVMSLKRAAKPLSLSAQRLKGAAVSAVNKDTGPLVQPIRLKPRQAVDATPENLQWVSEEGIFYGTYRSPPSASQPRSTYYIRSRGRYFQVKEDAYFGGLCLVDASRPGALYNMPIRRMTNGKWTHNSVGLRGGNDGVRNLGRVDDLREAFPGRVDPDVTRGALQGEAVVARFNEATADGYLFSLNAQTCVIASLYNPVTRVGAVIHFDHNIGRLIEEGVEALLRRLGGSAKDIRVTLVGGDWLTGLDIGEPVRTVMRRKGLEPTWDFWSYSSCFGNTYGVSLNLKSGITSVFKMSQTQVERYYAPVLSRAKYSTDPVSIRARRFMTRTRSEPLMANANGAVRTRQGRPATTAQLAMNRFSMVSLN